MSEQNLGGDPSIGTPVEEPFLGEHIPIGLAVFEPVVPVHLQDRPRIDIPVEIANIQEAVDFEPKHGRWQIAKDIIGLVRHHKDGVETYRDKLLREERRGKNESATFGLATFGEQQAVLYAMNWDFFAGSLGVIAGEKFQAAADLAESKKLPFISIYASSGVRQHENVAGLTQMTRMVESIRHYKGKVAQPHVAVLLGNVWGGVSASAVPNADVVVALAGTNYGFAGPRVIEAHEGTAVPDGAQSAEANLMDRNIDVILRDTPELIDYLSALLSTSQVPDKQHALTPQAEPRLQNIHPEGDGRIFSFDGVGIKSPIRNTTEQPATPIVLKNKEHSADSTREDQLASQFQDLIIDANRVDLDFILHHAFTDTLPLYNHVEDGDIKRYPAVVAALGKIGSQPFLIVGSQPSYQKLGTKVRKLPASPGPQDFEYMERMLEMGGRLNLPAVFVTDTLGAEPTLSNERQGLSRSIASLMMKSIEYPQPVISIISGALGSGGGLATTPMIDRVMMLENAMAFVSEPRSATSILYNTPNPDPELIKQTLSTMRPTAADQLELGLVDEVVTETTDPYETAEHIHKAIFDTYVTLAAQSSRQLHSERRKKIRKLSGFEIVRE